MALRSALSVLKILSAKAYLLAPSGRSRGSGAAMTRAKAASNAFTNPRRALLHCDNPLAESWEKALRSAGVDLAVWPDVEENEFAAIRFFICWKPPAEIFPKLTNLSAVQLQGAGVDSVISNPDIPTTVPLLRIADPLMGQRMAMWVLWAVLNTVRKMDAYYDAQRRKEWAKTTEGYDNRDNGTVHVGILGLGVMGRETADTLSSLGFQVSSWTRHPRQHKGVKNFSGRESLQAFVEQCEFLVCLLPLTPDTRGIIDEELLSWLPPGATVINGARGGHMVEADVVAALDGGALAGLVTDVTDPEPLLEGSRLWDHPKVRLTPHVAAFTPVPTAAAQMAENYRAVLAGEAVVPERIVDRDAGY